ncbi:hypothetical protein X748_04085 [Mesorhizobium sp. LNJC386A00]|nr:hypothetical protein X748_04085 [Mesorhizobium sp. LNJC386A00]
MQIEKHGSGRFREAAEMLRISGMMSVAERRLITEIF